MALNPAPPTIDVPDATAEPDAYVKVLLDLATDRDPLSVPAVTPARVRELAAGTPVALFDRVPEPGEWSPAAVVGHLFDVDMVYGFRWRLVLTEHDPAYPGYDEKRWSTLARLPFWQSLDAWSGLRAANQAMLNAVPRADWERLTGHHGEQGGENFGTMVRKVAGHDIAHLNQFYRALRAVRAAEGLDVDALDALYAGFEG